MNDNNETFDYLIERRRSLTLNNDEFLNSHNANEEDKGSARPEVRGTAEIRIFLKCHQKILIIKMNAVTTSDATERLFVNMDIEGRNVKFQIDTGCGVSIVPMSVYKLFSDIVTLKDCNM